MVNEKEEMKEILSKLIYKNEKTLINLKNKTEHILASLNQSDSMNITDTECAMSDSTIKMLIKIDNGELCFPDDLRGTKEALVMGTLQGFVKNYLLKRYARRINRKTKAQYNLELKHAASDQKINRHEGGRFESISKMNDNKDIDIESIDNPYALETNMLIKLLKAKRLTERDHQILYYRLEGCNYEEIAKLLVTTKTGKPATKNSVRLEHTRAMKMAEIDLSIFKS